MGMAYACDSIMHIAHCKLQTTHCIYVCLGLAQTDGPAQQTLFAHILIGQQSAFNWLRSMLHSRNF